MEEKLNGIVLSAVPYGENDKILNIFTLEKGSVSARIKGVKKAGAKLKFASEPFCFAEFIFHTKEDNRVVTNASLTDSFYPIREDLKKFFCGATVLEFVKRFYKSGIVSPEVFMLTVSALKGLSYGDENPKKVLAQFLLEGFNLIGFGLNLNGCVECGKEEILRPFFDYESGGFYCEECFNGNGREINAVTYHALRKLANGQSVTDEEATFCLRLMDFYLVYKLEEKLTSLKELLNVND